MSREAVKPQRCSVYLNGKIQCLLNAGHVTAGISEHSYDPAAEADAQRAREEKRGRMLELVKALQLPNGEISYYGPTDDHAGIKFKSHRYEIREIE